MNKERQDLEAVFPGLRTSRSFHVKSPCDARYNCIAWAADDSSRWWWPHPNSYWPEQAPRALTLSAFEQAYALLGYSPCESDELEGGFEKIAVFVDSNNIPTHAARQLATGSWVSKMGKSYDIEHSLKDVEGSCYGTVGRIMKRKAY